MTGYRSQPPRAGGKRPRRHVALGAAYTFLVLLTATTSELYATEAVQLDDEELVARSVRIVDAEVLTKRCVQVADGRIYTEYRLRIREALKGGGRPGEELIFREWGGEVDGIRYWIPGCGRFEVGARVVAFLAPVDPRTGVGFTTGLAQGKVHVVDSAAGPVAVRTFADLTLRAPDGSARTRALPTREPLSTLLARIRALVHARR